MANNINFASLIAKAQKIPAIKTAIVHPVSQEAITGSIEATKSKLIIPILIGPLHKIKQAALQAQIDLSPYEIITTEHSHAAAQQAVFLARNGKVDMLMKGSLSTAELMLAIVNKDTGLRTGQRMSHVFTIEKINYDKLLLLTDCALNISPSLLDKRDIVQNAIDLAHAIDINIPKVAILSALEIVTEKLKSTIDAAALCKMADRGQIVGGVLDGPLGFDNAVSVQAAKIKRIVSPVAGNADILLTPDLEAGNMLAKQLQYLAKAQLAGIVLGARVPIVLTSRADTAHARLVSCALGQIYRQFLLQKKPPCNLLC